VPYNLGVAQSHHPLEIHVTDAVERLVNLAFYLAEAREPVSAERVRVDVAGYAVDQDTEAFLRMFERDKDALRDAGLAIVSDDGMTYRLDRTATFAASLELTPQEAAAVRAAGGALLGDPSFPFAADLRLALAKIASTIDTGTIASAARLADENPAQQGELVAAFSDAAERRKSVTFAYTNSRGASAPHTIEPYGLFLHDGRWYVVGRDAVKDEIRTYTVARMSDIAVNASRPKSPDFERPAGFDVAAFARLAFQYGPAAEQFEAAVRFDVSSAWRAEQLASGHGTVERTPDCGALWRIPARDRARLLRFVIENGPGLSLAEPPEAAARLRRGMEEVVRLHG
jgi:proteasome accessory factor B